MNANKIRYLRILYIYLTSLQFIFSEVKKFISRLMNYEEVFNKFLILSGNSDDLDEINAANEYILEFKANTEECIKWIINTFSEVDNIIIRIQQLILIRNYCKFDMDDLPLLVRK